MIDNNKTAIYKKENNLSDILHLNIQMPKEREKQAYIE